MVFGTAEVAFLEFDLIEESKALVEGQRKLGFVETEAEVEEAGGFVVVKGEGERASALELGEVYGKVAEGQMQQIVAPSLYFEVQFDGLAFVLGACKAAAEPLLSPAYPLRPEHQIVPAFPQDGRKPQSLTSRLFYFCFYLPSVTSLCLISQKEGTTRERKGREKEDKKKERSFP